MGVPSSDGAVMEFDLFEFYRWMIAVICTIYATVITWHSLTAWLAWFKSSRPTVMMGRYVSVQLLRVRILKFGFEIAQILALSALLGLLIYWHGVLEYGS